MRPIPRESGVSPCPTSTSRASFHFLVPISLTLKSQQRVSLKSARVLTGTGRVRKVQNRKFFRYSPVGESRVKSVQ